MEFCPGGIETDKEEVEEVTEEMMMWIFITSRILVFIQTETNKVCKRDPVILFCKK